MIEQRRKINSINWKVNVTFIRKKRCKNRFDELSQIILWNEPNYLDTFYVIYYTIKEYKIQKIHRQTEKTMDNKLKEKLEEILKEVDVLMVDPDIEIEYCIPEVSQTHSTCDITGTPYIIVKCAENKYVERKIRLTDRYIDNTPKDSLSWRGMLEGIPIAKKELANLTDSDGKDPVFVFEQEMAIYPQNPFSNQFVK